VYLGSVRAAIASIFLFGFGVFGVLFALAGLDNRTS